MLPFIKKKGDCDRYQEESEDNCNNKLSLCRSCKSKVVVPLNDMQTWSLENVKVLKVIHATINAIQEWGAKYKNELSELARKKSRKQNWKRLRFEWIYRVISSLVYITDYARLYHSLDSLVRAHKIAFVRAFVETKGRNLIR